MKKGGDHLHMHCHVFKPCLMAACLPRACPFLLYRQVYVVYLLTHNTSASTHSLQGTRCSPWAHTSCWAGAPQPWENANS